MKITVVTGYYAPELTPVTHLLSDLCSDLAAYGHEVTVVTNLADRGLTETERLAYFDRCDEKVSDNLRILRAGAKTREQGGLLKRALRFVGNTKLLYEQAKQLDTDVYLLFSTPPFLGLVGEKLAKRKKTVYVVQDIFPDSLVATGKFASKHPAVKLMRRLEKRIYRGNSAIVTVSDDMAKTLEMRHVPKEKLSVIGNWADTTAIRPVLREDNPLFSDWGIDPDGFYVVYAGNLGLLQDLDTALSAMQIVKNNGIDATLLLIGNGAAKSHLVDRIQKENIENVQLFAMQSLDKVGAVYSLGDVNLISLKSHVTEIAMPSKTWSAMAAGRPVIVTADDGSAWEKTINDSGAGLTVLPGDPRGLSIAIERMYRMQQELPKMGENARAYVTDKVTRAQATKAYETLLHRVADDKENQ